MNLDMYPTPVSHGIGTKSITQFCSSPYCTNAVAPGKEYCTTCEAENEIDRISQMKVDQFVKLLDSLFEGEEKDFDVCDSEIVLTYYCTNKERLQKADYLLNAYGSKEHKVWEEKVVFSLKNKDHGFWSELDIA